jgi:hypothetical protein
MPGNIVETQKDELRLCGINGRTLWILSINFGKVED